MLPPERHPWSDDPDDNTGWYDADNMDEYVTHLKQVADAFRISLETSNAKLKEAMDALDYVKGCTSLADCNSHWSEVQTTLKKLRCNHSWDVSGVCELCGLGYKERWGEK